MRWIAINPRRAVLDGTPVETVSTGKDLLTELYRKYADDYPKFFKMDGLCKLGLVASELLLRRERAEETTPQESRAVVLFGRTGSGDADKHFQATICDKANYYPSPSLFVYTLPNIVTGEIAIRNKYHGETAFYLTEQFSAETIASVCAAAFCDDTTMSIVSGWIDFRDANCFQCLMFLATREEAKDTETITNQINEIKQYI